METKDLILGKAKQEDWRAMYHNVWGRPESFRYMCYELSNNEEEARERMRRTAEFQRGHDAFTVFLKATGEAIGFAGVERLDGAVWQETGICLGPDFWRRGYGGQILQCLLDYVRGQGAKEFRYSAWEENAASRALAQRFGFELCGKEEHIRSHDGKPYTLMKYRLGV